MFSLATVNYASAQIPVVKIADSCWPLSASRLHGFVGLDIDIKGLLANWPLVLPELRRFADACSKGQLSSASPIATSNVSFALPIQFPNKVVAVGANYHDHLKEMGASVPKSKHPIMFIKPPTTSLTGEGDVLLPEGCLQFDWEVEIAVVLGKRLRRADRSEVMDAVAGYSVSIDFTARDLFYREDFYFKYDFLLGKGQDAMTPLGPVILPAEFVKNPHGLKFGLYVNGALKQNASTNGMIYSIDEQLSSISQFVTLEPGDVVLTGSPAGVGFPRGEFLKVGDTVKAFAEGIGDLNVRIAAA